MSSAVLFILYSGLTGARPAAVVGAGADHARGTRAAGQRASLSAHDARAAARRRDRTRLPDRLVRALLPPCAPRFPCAAGCSRWGWCSSASPWSSRGRARARAASLVRVDVDTPGPPLRYSPHDPRSTSFAASGVAPRSPIIATPSSSSATGCGSGRSTRRELRTHRPHGGVGRTPERCGRRCGLRDALLTRSPPLSRSGS